MLKIINTKILISGAVILAAAALIIGGTFAFFSDTETSTGNVLAAGAIDLQIDNESYVTDVNGVLVASPNTSWELSDLTVEKFFNFTDLKPGDIGEDTISLHVNNNDAWVCAAARVTENADVDCTDPENTDDLSCGTGDALTNGDLAGQVNFAFWKDDGDNVLEVGESPFLSGPISGLNGAGQIALADSTQNAVFGANTPIPGGSDQYIGKAWCFGTLTPNPVAQGADTSPLVRGTGFTCNGSDVDNAAQTDRVTADLQFYAVQSRNNSTFTCAEDYTPDWGDAVAAPVVDGIISEGEYDGALSMLITNAGGGTVKAKTQGGFLYLAADIPTDLTDNRVVPGFNDEFGVNLGESPATDTIIRALGTTNANGRTFGPTDGLWSNFDPTGYEIKSLFGTGHRVLEFKIPLSAIPGVVNGDTLTIGGATESTDGNSAVYPTGLIWGTVGTYGTLVVTP